MLDIGGATGEFVHYINRTYQNMKTTCLDAYEELVIRGKKNVPNSEFVVGDANNMIFKDEAFDVVTMLGVIGIFDDFKPSLSECLRVAKKDGIVILHGVFNEFPIDALIRWKYSGESGPYNLGRNVFSKKTISDFLDINEKVKSYSFEKFTLPFDLHPRKDDPNRSWTELDSSGSRILKNGLMELNEQILFIQT